MAGMQGPRRIGTNLSGGRVFSGNPASMGNVSSIHQNMMFQRASMSTGENGSTHLGVPEIHHRLLASPATVQTGGMVRQGLSTGTGTIFTSPSFYSPYHTPSSWQIPTVRREVYKWCLHPDTLITMSDMTQRRMCDVKIGDSVICGDGSVGEVTITSDLHYTGNLRNIEVVGIDGRLSCTPDHRLYRVKESSVACKHFKSSFRFCRQKYACESKDCRDWESLSDKIEIEEVEASDLQVGDFLIQPAGFLINNHGNDFSPDLMRLFGYYLSEGSIGFDERKETPTPKRITFSFGIHEYDLIEDCIQIIRDEFGYDPKTDTTSFNTVRRIHINRVDLASLFFDLLGKRAGEKAISARVLRQTPDRLRHLLIGYLLGDGNRTNLGNIRLTTESASLASQIHMLMTGMRIKSNIKKETVENNQDAYRCMVNGGDVDDFLVDAPTIGNLKLAAQSERSKSNSKSIVVGNHILRRVKSISDEPYEGSVLDMRVDNETGIHRFLANFVVVSNCEYWVSNEPRIAIAIDFYSEFPMSGFDLECSDASVKEFFENLVKRIRLEERLPEILREYYSKGDAFVMCNLDCDKCGGSGIDQNGKECDHKGATWRGVSVLNPEEVEVSPFSNIMPDPPIYVLPNADLKKLVQTGQPKDIFQSLPQQTRDAIRKGLPILMDPLTITHLKHASSPYQTYGQSIIRRLFPTLVYKDKLRQAQYLIAERHVVPIKIVKIGTEQRPASQEDISDVQERLAEVANDPLLTLVTHHAFDYEWVGSSGKVLQLTNEFDLIEGEMIDGLGLSKAILSGEGPTYANAQVGIEVLAKRLETVRNKIANWIEEKVFRPIAMFNGFTKTNDRGEDEWVYPTIKWEELRLRDNTPRIQYMWEARKAGDISAQTFIEEALDLSFDQEVERMRLEEMSAVLSNPQLELGSMGGGMGAGYGGSPMDDLGGMGGGGGMMPPPPGGGAPPSGGEAPPPGGGVPGAPPGAEGAGMPTPIGMGPSANALVSNYMTVVSQIEDLSDGEDPHRSRTTIGNGHRGKLSNEPDVTDISLMSYEGMNRLSFGHPKKNDNGITHKSFFTSVEQALYKAILSQRFPYDFWAQYSVNGDPKMRVDGAFPDIKLAVEADGREWHSDPDSIEKDKRRDSYLASQGWMVLRFTEEEIGKRMKEVIAVISKAINQKVQSLGTRVASEIIKSKME